MEVELYGLPVDTQRRAHRTKPMIGPHPVWGEDSKEFQFRKVSKYSGLLLGPSIWFTMGTSASVSHLHRSFSLRWL